MKMMDDNGLLTAVMQSMIHNTNDLLFVKDKNFIYIAASAAFALECAGCGNAEEIIGKTDFDIFEDRELAQRYRNDDIKLFESGRAMAEFREVLVDRKGKKHLCLTTKYLLHDKYGNPAGLLGQYHEISKQLDEEFAQRRDLNVKVAQALNGVYFASNYVDLRSHTYISLHGKDYTKKMIEGCDTIEEAFEAFITTLVREEYRPRMREFCEPDSIAERLKGKTHIDCEYLSLVAEGWCQATFIPAEWDKQGNITHVLFVVSDIDSVKVREIEEGIANKKDLEIIFDEVPGGIVQYEWTGKRLKTLKMSRYYMGLSGVSNPDDNRSPDFNKVHPDDREDFYNACIYALNNTHILEYVYRVYNTQLGRYVWTQINAISKPRKDGTALVYAMYTDVTEQKIVEQRLMKSNAAIMAALGAADQFSYEYDPVMHTSTCFTDENNGYRLEKVIVDYPECFRKMDFMHPEDVEKFIETAHRIDNGSSSVHCDVRVRKDGRYHWHSCTFDAFYDAEKERRVALLTVVDITPRMTALSSYEERLRSIISAQADVLSMCRINLTGNSFEMLQKAGELKLQIDDSLDFETVMLGAAVNIIGDESKKRYCELFSRENLLSEAEKGNMHVQYEYLFRLSEGRYEWVIAAVDMIRNPLTGEICGTAYCKSAQISHMSEELLETTLKLDYILASVVFRDTDEFYLYYSRQGRFSERMLDFWNNALSTQKPKCSDETMDYLKSVFDKEKMLDYLDNHQEFSYAYDSIYKDRKSRLEIKFRYLDNARSMIFASLRDITDAALYEKYKYDSEHDQLTGLMNRNTLFRRCRQLLEEHPDEQFVIMHGDMKHFHLYNTFFGDEAGDRLLCSVAECLHEMDKDYDYWAYGRIEADVFCTFFPLRQDIFNKHVSLFRNRIGKIRSDFLIEPALGVYYVNDPSMPIESMFTRATIAAKSDNRKLYNMISLYDDEMEAELTASQQIICEMQHAVEQEQFRVYLQPKYSLRTGKVTGAEALVRWVHPEKGMISPEKFIPLFERNGFIAELDRYMWEHVCRQIRRWIDDGISVYPVSVNVSRISMYAQSTVSYLKNLVTEYGIEPRYLELELTESAYMDDPVEMKRQLIELQQFGFHILMDDFGSGYSSLNTLRELPVDVLKLDMRFLSEAQNDSRGRAVLSSVVRMSKLLNLPIVAEGVEKSEQAEYLRSLGCEYVQGFLYARPMLIEDYEKLLMEEERKEYSEVVTGTDMSEDCVPDVNSVQVPYGILEYGEKHFAYLQVNDSFMTEFGLLGDLRPASQRFREHLDDRSYAVLLDAFERCIQSRKKIWFRIRWKEEGNTAQEYLGNVVSIGYTGNSANLAVAFNNITESEMIGL